MEAEENWELKRKSMDVENGDLWNSWWLSRTFPKDTEISCLCGGYSGRHLMFFLKIWLPIFQSNYMRTRFILLNNAICVCAGTIFLSKLNSSAFIEFLKLQWIFIHVFHSLCCPEWVKLFLITFTYISFSTATSEYHLVLNAPSLYWIVFPCGHSKLYFSVWLLTLTVQSV